MTKIVGNKLQNAEWLETKALKKLFEVFLVKGDEVKIVGGAPRNHLLGKTVEDIDLATIYTPDEIIAKARQAGLKTIPTGIEHGTVTLLIDNTAYEITTLRADVKTDGRYAVVEFGTNWSEDAKRRDFTINALYVLKDGTLEDPLGTGLKDIKSQRVRFIGKAEDRIQEDYLRSLRYYRFAAFYSKPPFDPLAISATIKLKDGLRSLSAERVKAELFKIISAPEPIEVINELYSNGILTALIGSVPNIKSFHKYVQLDNKQNHKPDPAIRLAVLAAWHKGDVERLTKRLRLSKKEARQIELVVKADIEKNALISSLDETSQEGKYHYHTYQTKWGKQEYITLLKVLYASGNCPLDQQGLIEKLKTSERYEQRAFPVNGADLMAMGIKSGPEVGKILEQLMRKWLQSERELTKNELLALLDR